MTPTDQDGPTMRLFSTLAVALTFAPAALAQGKYEYNRDIRPILAENCFA